MTALKEKTIFTTKKKINNLAFKTGFMPFSNSKNREIFFHPENREILSKTGRLTVNSDNFVQTAINVYII